MIFLNRADAGRHLAAKLTGYANDPRVIVFALAPGGIPVGCEVARRLGVSLEVYRQTEFGVADTDKLATESVATANITRIDRDSVRYLHTTRPAIDTIASKEQKQLRRDAENYRRNRTLPEINNRIVILIDDGLANGLVIRAAVNALRINGPSRIVVAVPVLRKETCDEFCGEVDEIVCLVTPESFEGAGWWYEDFSQTTDRDLIDLLDQAKNFPLSTQRTRAATS